MKTLHMDTLEMKEYHLNDTGSKVLKVPGGHHNGFEALAEGSGLMIFSDVDLDSSKADDYRVSLDKLKW